jgi:hypothetical protein
MRYHWGLGVGHFHAHQPASTSCRIPEEGTRGVDPPESQPEKITDASNVNLQLLGENGYDYNSDDPELTLDDRHLEGWEDIGSDSGDDAPEPNEDMDDGMD